MKSTPFSKVSQKTNFQYCQNKMLKRAVERNLEIIGEAMNRILTKAPSLQNKISSAKSIIGLRNQIIHAYDNISDENIWSILTAHLPVLKKEVKLLITKLEA
ncbi:MAG: DUF86 domain-containing protein [Bacteroidota bacterium]